MAKNKPTHVSKPVYPGGLTAMRKFVASNLKYPPKALAAKVEGKVTVRYSLDYRGKVVDAKIKSGLGYGCDEEAMRVVRMLRFEVPQERKKKIRIHQDVNIHFKLPKPKPSTALKTSPAPAAAPTTKSNDAAGQTSITYVSVPASGKVAGKVAKKPAASAPATTYTYTITTK